MVNLKDIAGNTEKWLTPEYSWEHRRRMVNPRDIAGNAEDICYDNIATMLTGKS